jgi:hypothetical protein
VVVVVEVLDLVVVEEQEILPLSVQLKEQMVDLLVTLVQGMELVVAVEQVEQEIMEQIQQVV